MQPVFFNIVWIITTATTFGGFLGAKTITGISYTLFHVIFFPDHKSIDNYLKLRDEKIGMHCVNAFIYIAYDYTEFTYSHIGICREKIHILAYEIAS